MGKGATFTAGIHWLGQCTQSWLLVIDNADDPELDITKYLPSGGSGHILVTTRNPRLSIYATAGNIRFSGMDPEEGVKLLLRTAFPVDDDMPENGGNRQTARLIASELGFLALALAHAGTTIRRKIYTLDKYLHYYLDHRRRMIASPYIRSVEDANIIATWDIPFQKIVNRRDLESQDAADLVNILGFLHFESIPEAIFRRRWNGISNARLLTSLHSLSDNDSGYDEESQTRVRAALSVLYEHSIIDHDAVKGVVTLHPIVQRWAQDRLSDEARKSWLNIAMAMLARCISPNMEASGRSFRRSLLPHIEACMRAFHSLTGSTRPQTLGRTSELERFGMILAENGLWSKARNYQNDVLAFRMQKLGRLNQRTVQAQRQLSQTQWNLFDIKPAIMTQLQILGTYWLSRPTFGDWLTWPPWRPKHIGYCTTLSDLTLSLWLAGRRERSQQLGERAVIGLLNRLGPDDPLTLTAQFNLARTYLHLGKTASSHTLLTQVLGKHRRLFGANHPDTLMTRNELGMCLCAQKRHLTAAESLVANVLAARKRILGEEHAYTLWSMNDLAKVLCTRRRADEAMNILEYVVPIVSRTLGERHVGMTMTKSNLALAYVIAKKWNEAEITLRDVLARVPEDHPDRIHIMSGFTYVKICIGKLDEAEEDGLGLLEQIKNQKMSVKSSRTRAIVEQLAVVYRKQGRTEALGELLKKYPGAEAPKELNFDAWQM